MISHCYQYPLSRSPPETAQFCLAPIEAHVLPDKGKSRGQTLRECCPSPPSASIWTPPIPGNIGCTQLGFFSFSHLLFLKWGFPGGLDHKESACSAEDLGLIPGPGRSPGEGNGNPLQYYTFSLEHWVKFSGPGQGGNLSGPDKVLVIQYSTAAAPLKITVTSSDLSLISFDLRLIYSPPWNTSFTGFLGYLTLHILPLPPWLFFLHLSSCPWSSLHLFALFGVWGQAQRCPFLFSTYTHTFVPVLISPSVVVFLKVRTPDACIQDSYAVSPEYI